VSFYPLKKPQNRQRRPRKHLCCQLRMCTFHNIAMVDNTWRTPCWKWALLQRSAANRVPCLQLFHFPNRILRSYIPNSDCANLYMVEYVLCLDVRRISGTVPLPRQVCDFYHSVSRSFDCRPFSGDNPTTVSSSRSVPR